MSASSNHHRILIIDDNSAIHEDFRRVLRNETPASALDSLEADLFDEAPAPPPDEQDTFEVDCALQGQEGLEKLKQAIAEDRPYAVAFVDMRMPPGWNGIETIRQLWRVDRSLQVVICSAYSDYSPEEIAQALRSSGKMLILRKPFDHLEVRQLASTLGSKWQINRRRGELEAMVEERTAELKKLAMQDVLTGLPNRLVFNDALARALARARREEAYRCAVLCVDVDDFKVVNDSLGHQAGDQLLLQIAQRLRASVREVDTVCCANQPPASEAPAMAARLGGDEFAILLDGLRADEDAARVAQRVLERLQEPYCVCGHSVHSTASIGITTSSAGYDNPEDMLRDADTALYQAKRDGRARFALFDQQMHARAVARLTFEADLQAALRENQIFLNYQPIISLHTGQLCGFEALARWKHPTRGWISPAEFIPLAEETGAILPLGLALLRQACQQLVRWQAEWPALADLTMSVNVSRKQLAVPDFVEQVQSIIRQTGIDPRNLKLEITESVMARDMRASAEVLQRIQDLNVQIHLDDFGSGYSSLSCLQNFPIDGVKIDRDFVAEVAHNPDQAAIIRAVVALSHGLHIPLVAEGIETVEQKQALQAMGCDQAQGYLFAKPMDAAAAREFIARYTAAAATLAA